jgi:hypothetical protein
MADEDDKKVRSRKLNKREREVFDRHHKQKKELLTLKNRMRHHEAGAPGFTYQQLRDALANMTPEQLAQQVEILGPCGSIGAPVMLEPVIGAGTIEELCHVDGKVETDTRSSVDFKHHPESFVLLSDYCGFGEDGDTAYTFGTDEDGETIWIGNVTGKKRPLIERRENEPTVFASRTHGFARTIYSESKPLMDRQEELCRKAELTAEENQELLGIQAELYRRLFRLSKKKS